MGSLPQSIPHAWRDRPHDYPHPARIRVHPVAQQQRPVPEGRQPVDRPLTARRQQRPLVTEDPETVAAFSGLSEDAAALAVLGIIAVERFTGVRLDASPADPPARVYRVLRH